MRVAKYIHACLLVEEGGQSLLFDPGKFTFIEGRVKPEQFTGIRAIVLTHGHPDHLDTDAVHRIAAANNAEIFANTEAVAALQKAGIAATLFETGERTVGAFTLRALPAAHEQVLGSQAPQNTAWLVNGKLLVTGDSFDDALLVCKGVELAAVPVMAPYLTELRVAAFVDKLAPKQLLPVHDGYAKDFFLKQRYAAYSQEFEKHGIRFHSAIEPGYSVTL